MNISKISLFLFITFFQVSTVNAWWPFGSSNQPKKMQPFNELTAQAADFAYLRSIAQTHNRKNVKAIAFTQEEQERYNAMTWEALDAFNEIIFETLNSSSKTKAMPAFTREEEQRSAEFLLLAEKDVLYGYKYPFFLNSDTFAFLITLLGSPKNTAIAEQFILDRTTSRIDRGDEIDSSVSTEAFKTIFCATSENFQRNYAIERLNKPGCYNARFEDFFKYIIKQS